MKKEILVAISVAGVLFGMIRGLCGPALIKTASTIIMRAFLNSRLSGTLWS